MNGDLAEVANPPHRCDLGHGRRFRCIALPDRRPRPDQADRPVPGRSGPRSSAVGGPEPAGRVTAAGPQRIRSFGSRGALPSGRLVTAEEHLVDLALFRSRDLIDRLRRRTMAPIGGLTPKAHDRMAETALAYVETPATLPRWPTASTSTRRRPGTRIARLRFFGDDLDRPDRRLALELSLRTR